MPETSQPLVTVIVCVYNAGRFLRPSIESILAQTYKNLEVLIINDGSTDGCLDHIRDLTDPRIRIITQENKGKPTAMNVGLDAMTGDFYALNDADDLSHPRRIEVLVRAMQDYPQVAAVFSGHELILNDRHMAPVLAARSPSECRQDIAVFRMPAHDPTAMYRMSLVGTMRYNPELPIVEGFDYMLRVGEAHPMLVVGECLYSYRIHGQSVTKRNPERRERLVREVLRLACERRKLDFAATFPTANGPVSNYNRDLDNNLAAHFMESAVDLHTEGRYLDAIRTGLACARLQPFDPHYYKALLYAVLPARIRRVVRPSERRRSAPIAEESSMVSASPAHPR